MAGRTHTLPRLSMLLAARRGTSDALAVVAVECRFRRFGKWRKRKSLSCVSSAMDSRLRSLSTQVGAIIAQTDAYEQELAELLAAEQALLRQRDALVIRLKVAEARAAAAAARAPARPRNPPRAYDDVTPAMPQQLKAAPKRKKPAASLPPATTTTTRNSSVLVIPPMNSIIPSSSTFQRATVSKYFGSPVTLLPSSLMLKLKSTSANSPSLSSAASNIALLPFQRPSYTAPSSSLAIESDEDDDDVDNNSNNDRPFSQALLPSSITMQQQQHPQQRQSSHPAQLSLSKLSSLFTSNPELVRPAPTPASTQPLLPSFHSMQSTSREDDVACIIDDYYITPIPTPTEPALPMVVSHTLIVQSLGSIDSRPLYRTGAYVYPVGYRVMRLSFGEGGVPVGNYECSIRDGGAAPLVRARTCRYLYYMGCSSRYPPVWLGERRCSVDTLRTRARHSWALRRR